MGVGKPTPEGGNKMAKYRVDMMEKTYYRFYVEADNLDEAEERAIEVYRKGDAEVTDCYVNDICVEEEIV